MIKESVSIVVPVYNDIRSLKKTIPIVCDYLQSHVITYELIIAEDASTDGSCEYAAECAKKYNFINHIHRKERKGRGSALSEAARLAKGNIICYFDVDLATDLKHLEELLLTIEDGADLTTGSRLLSDSNIDRSLEREIKSRGYNFLVRIFLKSKLYDHQCGFKAFRRSALLQLIEEVDNDHWFWDTEILVRGQKKGYIIKEIPVIWREGEGTTVKNQDIWKMAIEIIKLWWQINYIKDRRNL